MAWSGLTLPKRPISDEIPIGPPNVTIPEGGLPLWSRLPYDSKIPLPHCPKGLIEISMTTLGRKPKVTYPNDEHREFDTGDENLYCYPVETEYNPLTDPHLRRYFMSLPRFRELVRRGQVTSDGRVRCSLADYNRYRRCLYRSWGIEVDRLDSNQLREEKMRMKVRFLEATNENEGRVPAFYKRISEEAQNRWILYQRELFYEYPEEYPAVARWLSRSSKHYRNVTNLQIAKHRERERKVRRFWNELRKQNMAYIEEEKRVRESESILQKKLQEKRYNDYKKLWDKNYSRLAEASMKRKSKVKTELKRVQALIGRFRAKRAEALLEQPEEGSSGRSDSYWDIRDTLDSVIDLLHERRAEEAKLMETRPRKESRASSARPDTFDEYSSETIRSEGFATDIETEGATTESEEYMERGVKSRPRESSEQRWTIASDLMQDILRQTEYPGSRGKPDAKNLVRGLTTVIESHLRSDIEVDLQGANASEEDSSSTYPEDFSIPSGSKSMEGGVPSSPALSVVVEEIEDSGTDEQMDSGQIGGDIVRQAVEDALKMVEANLINEISSRSSFDAGYGYRKLIIDEDYEKYRKEEIQDAIRSVISSLKDELISTVEWKIETMIEDHNRRPTTEEIKVMAETAVLDMIESEKENIVKLIDDLVKDVDTVDSNKELEDVANETLERALPEAISRVADEIMMDASVYLEGTEGLLSATEIQEGLLRLKDNAVLELHFESPVVIETVKQQLSGRPGLKAMPRDQLEIVIQESLSEIVEAEKHRLLKQIHRNLESLEFSKETVKDVLKLSLAAAAYQKRETERRESRDEQSSKAIGRLDRLHALINDLVEEEKGIIREQAYQKLQTITLDQDDEAKQVRDSFEEDVESAIDDFGARMDRVIETKLSAIEAFVREPKIDEISLNNIVLDDFKQVLQIEREAILDNIGSGSYPKTSPQYRTMIDEEKAASSISEEELIPAEYPSSQQELRVDITFPSTGESETMIEGTRQSDVTFEMDKVLETIDSGELSYSVQDPESSGQGFTGYENTDRERFAIREDMEKPLGDERDPGYPESELGLEDERSREKSSNLQAYAFSGSEAQKDSTTSSLGSKQQAQNVLDSVDTGVASAENEIPEVVDTRKSEETIAPVITKEENDQQSYSAAKSEELDAESEGEKIADTSTPKTAGSRADRSDSITDRQIEESLIDELENQVLESENASLPRRDKQDYTSAVTTSEEMENEKDNLEASTGSKILEPRMDKTDSFTDIQIEEALISDLENQVLESENTLPSSRDKQDYPSAVTRSEEMENKRDNLEASTGSKILEPRMDRSDSFTDIQIEEALISDLENQVLESENTLPSRRDKQDYPSAVTRSEEMENKRDNVEASTGSNILEPRTDRSDSITDIQIEEALISELENKVLENENISSSPGTSNPRMENVDTDNSEDDGRTGSYLSDNARNVDSTDRSEDDEGKEGGNSFEEYAVNNLTCHYFKPFLERIVSRKRKCLVSLNDFYGYHLPFKVFRTVETSAKLQPLVVEITVIISEFTFFSIKLHFVIFIPCKLGPRFDTRTAMVRTTSGFRRQRAVALAKTWGSSSSLIKGCSGCQNYKETNDRKYFSQQLYEAFFASSCVNISKNGRTTSSPDLSTWSEHFDHSILLILLVFATIIGVKPKEKATSNVHESQEGKKTGCRKIMCECYDTTKSDNSLSAGVELTPCLVKNGKGITVKRIGKVKLLDLSEYFAGSLNMRTSPKPIEKLTSGIKYMLYLPVQTATLMSNNNNDNNKGKHGLKNKEFNHPLVDIFVAYNTSSLFGCHRNVGHLITIVAYPVNTQMSSFICRTPDNSGEVRRRSASLDERRHSPPDYGSEVSTKPRAASLYTISLHGQRYSQVPSTTSGFETTDPAVSGVSNLQDSKPLSGTKVKTRDTDEPLQDLLTETEESCARDSDSPSTDTYVECMSHLSDLSTPTGSTFEVQKSSHAHSKESECGIPASSSKSECIEDGRGTAIQRKLSDQPNCSDRDHTENEGNERMRMDQESLKQPAITGVFEARLHATIAGHGTMSFRKEFVLDSKGYDDNSEDSVDIIKARFTQKDSKNLGSSDPELEKSLLFSKNSAQASDTCFTDFSFQVVPPEKDRFPGQTMIDKLPPMPGIGHTRRPREEDDLVRAYVGRKYLIDKKCNADALQNQDTKVGFASMRAHSCKTLDEHVPFRPRSPTHTADLSFTDYSPGGGRAKVMRTQEELMIDMMSPMPRPDHKRRPSNEADYKRVDLVKEVLTETKTESERKHVGKPLQQHIPFCLSSPTHTADLSFTDYAPESASTKRRKSPEELLINEMSPMPSSGHTRRPSEDVEVDPKKIHIGKSNDLQEYLQKPTNEKLNPPKLDEESNYECTQQIDIPFYPPSPTHTTDLCFTDYSPKSTVVEKIEESDAISIHKMSPMPSLNHVRRSIEEESQAKRPVPRRDRETEKKCAAAKIEDHGGHRPAGEAKLKGKEENYRTQDDYLPFCPPRPTHTAELSFTDYSPSSMDIEKIRSPEEVLIDTMSPMPRPNHVRRPSEEADHEVDNQATKMFDMAGEIKSKTSEVKPKHASESHTPSRPHCTTPTIHFSSIDKRPGKVTTGKQRATEAVLIAKKGSPPRSNHKRVPSNDESWYSTNEEIPTKEAGKVKLASVLKTNSEEFETATLDDDSIRRSIKRVDATDDVTSSQTTKGTAIKEDLSTTERLSEDSFNTCDFSDSETDDNDNEAIKTHRRLTTMPTAGILEDALRIKSTKYKDLSTGDPRKASNESELVFMDFLYPSIQKIQLPEGSKEALKYTVMQEMLDSFIGTGKESIRRIREPMNEIRPGLFPSAAFHGPIEMQQAAQPAVKPSTASPRPRNMTKQDFYEKRSRRKTHRFCTEDFQAETGIGVVPSTNEGTASEVPIVTAIQDVRGETAAETQTKVDSERVSTEPVNSESVPVNRTLVGDVVTQREKSFEQNISVPELGDVKADLKISIDITFAKSEDGDSDVEIDENVTISDCPTEGDCNTQERQS